MNNILLLFPFLEMKKSSLRKLETLFTTFHGLFRLGKILYPHTQTLSD